MDRELMLSDFDYELPPELIAQEPVEPRDSSRLLVLHRSTGEIEHRRFRDLLDYLRTGDCLVLNDTKVMQGRLVGVKKGTGARVEVLLLRQLGPVQWEVLLKPGKKARPGAELCFGDGELEARVVDYTEAGGRIVEFSSRGDLTEALKLLGRVPLPPYIRRELHDPSRYQTVYAREEGSAAAPTAGLHFTEGLLERIRDKGVAVEFITLHIGLGTFRPVKTERIEEHRMHREYFVIPRDAAQGINQARTRGCRVFAVGTTPVRALETASDEDGRIQPMSGWTDIFIYPGYRFKAVDALITNFHLPRSTLLMLVCAFAGHQKVLAAYREAVMERYRFFSFGDAMLIL